MSSAAGGLAAVATAAVLWAVGGATARFLIDDGASALELTEGRAWIAAAGLGAWVLLRRPAGGRPGRRRPAVLVAFGLSIAAANLLYYVSLSLLPVAVAITVQYTAPALVVLWSAVAGRRAPGARVAGALVVVLAGVALLAGLPAALSGGTPVSPAGIAAAVGAALAFATYIVTGEHIERGWGAERGVALGFVVASGVWLVVQAARGIPQTLVDPAFVPGVIFLGVFTTIAPFFLFVWGLGHLEPSRAGIVSTLEPVAAAVIAFAWLGQKLTPAQIAGGVMVIAGIVVVQLEQSEPHEAEAIR